MLTERGIASLIRAGQPGWNTDRNTHGVGSLVLRITNAGTPLWYFRPAIGQRKPFQFGQYRTDGDGETTFTSKQARERANDLEALVRTGVSDLKEYFEAQHAAAEQAKAAAEAAQWAVEEQARIEAERLAKYNLQALFGTYATLLEKQGKKTSAREVRNVAKNWVTTPHPEIANKPAREVTIRDARVLIAGLTDANRGRTAGKLRSFGRTAYQNAIDVESNPDLPAELIDFAVVSNPFAAISSKALAKYNRTRDRALSLPETIAYREMLEALPAGASRDALLLALLLGGQRFSQLTRITREDVDLHGRTVTLRDPKGKRVLPRLHVVPLHGNALELLKLRVAKLDAATEVAERKGKPTPKHLLSHYGQLPVTVSTASSIVADISARLVAEKKVNAPFRLSDIRRTAETLLAGLGVSSDMRAHLQSHGLGGIQTRHYDRHSYMAEKRAALELWESQLYRRKAANRSAAATKRKPARKP
jgi:integrase